MSKARGLAVSLCAAAALLVAAPAAAGDAIVLAWDVAPGCPTHDEVLAQITKLTGPLGNAAELRADVVIRPTRDASFEARIQTESAGMKGARVFEGRTCAALSEAVVVMLALAADPYALTEPEPVPDAPPPTRPLLDPARAPRFDGVPPPPAPVATHLAIGVVGAGDLGTLAGATPGGGVRLALYRGALRLEIEGAIWASRFVASSRAPSSGGLVGFETLTPRLCVGGRGRVVAVDGCGGLALVFAHGEGVGIDHPTHDTTTFSAPELGVWVRQATAGRLSAFAGLAARVPLRRPEADITGLGAVFRPWAVTGLATVGLDVRLF